MAIKRFKIRKILSSLLLTSIILSQTTQPLLATELSPGISNNNNVSELTGEDANSQPTTDTTQGGAEGGSMVTDSTKMKDEYKKITTIEGLEINLYDILTDKEIEFRTKPEFINKLKANLDNYVSTFKSSVDSYKAKYGQYIDDKKLFDENGVIYSKSDATFYSLAAETIRLEFYGMRALTAFITLNQLGQASDIQDKYNEFLKYISTTMLDENDVSKALLHASPYYKGDKKDTEEYNSIYHRLIGDYLTLSKFYIPTDDEDTVKFLGDKTLIESILGLLYQKTNIKPDVTSLTIAWSIMNKKAGYENLLKSSIVTDKPVYSNEIGTSDWLTPIIYQLLGGTSTKSLDESLISEGGNINNAEITKKKVTDMKEGYTVLMSVAKDLADLYSMYGYNAKSTRFLNNINTSYGLYEDNYLKKLGLSSIENKDVQNVTDSSADKAYSTVQDIVGKQEYYELLAWTANFTPFETNINDMTDMSETLSKEARAIYNTYGLLRTPVYAVESSNALLTHMKKGNIRNVGYITLSEFIDRMPKGDIALLANKLSYDQIAKEKAGLVVNSQTTENGSATVISSTDTNNSTANADKFIGPIYMSSNDPTYGTAKGNNKAEKTAEKEFKENLKTTPITSSEGKVIEQTISNSAAIIASQAQHLTPAHLYLNYMLMWNTLQDGKYNTTGVSDDLNSPLYVDFLGNIVTQSGYIVVPVAANTTYYTELSKYPTLTAMFLNSYPTVGVGADSTIELSEADKNKFVLAVQRDTTKVSDFTFNGMGETSVITNGVNSPFYKWKIIRYDEKKMNKAKEKFFVASPTQSFYMNTEQGEGIMLKPSETSEVINLIDVATSFLDVGLPFVKYGFFKANSDAKVFSLNNFQSVRASVDGQSVTVSLNSISSLPTSSTWKVITSLVKNHLLLQEYNLGVIRTEQMLSQIMNSVLQGSTDPSQMLYDYEIKNYKEELRSNKLFNFIGSILESFINMVFNFLDVNVLLYTPTAYNTSESLYTHLWITPASIMLVALILIIVITALILRNMSNDGSNLGESIYVFAIIMFITIYNLQAHPQVMKFVFDTLPSKIISNQQALYVAYELEKEYKDNNDYFFNTSKGNKNMENRIVVKIKELSKDEALQLRQEDGSRPEVFTKFYNVKYDRIPLILMGEMYLQGTSIYAPLDYILGGAYLRDSTNANNTFNMDVELYDDGGLLSNYVAFYNILDSLVYTANAYTEGSSVALRILQYNNFAMTTGRAESYFNSIYFIAPDKAEDILKVYEQQYMKNIDDLVETTNEDYETIYHQSLLQAQEQSKLVLDTYTYMLEKLGDLDDWLGLKKVLLLNEGTNYPFTEDMESNIRLSYWFPNLDDYTENEIEYKIDKINSKIRHFVLTEMNDLLRYMSDDTIFKVIAWQATMEFNKEFSSIFTPSNERLYPQQLESDSLGNKFFIQSTYMTNKDIFNSPTTSFSYYVASNYGLLPLTLLVLDIPIKFVLYLIPLVGIFSLIFIPYLLVFFYFTKKSHLTKKVYGWMLVCTYTAFLRIILVLSYRLSLFLTNHFNLISVTVITLLIHTLIVIGSIAICGYILKNTDEVMDLVGGMSKSKLNRIGGMALSVGQSGYDSYTNYKNNQSEYYDNEVEDLGVHDSSQYQSMRQRNSIDISGLDTNILTYDSSTINSRFGNKSEKGEPKVERQNNTTSSNSFADKINSINKVTLDDTNNSDFVREKDKIKTKRDISVEESISKRFANNPHSKDFDSMA